MAQSKSVWIVTTDGHTPAADVAAALAGAGFEATSVLTEIGVITGRCTPAKVAQLRKLPGVAGIAADGPVDVGPPGSPRTW